MSDLDRYLFRGICKDTKKWVFGDIVVGRKICGIWQNGEQHSMSQVIPETVGQWTGLIDKNGVKIFEGDNFRFEITGSIHDHLLEVK